MSRRLGAAFALFVLGCRGAPAEPPNGAEHPTALVHPSQFGARCDSNGAAGTGADDTAALQAALDAAKAIHGTVVVRGTCRATRTLVWSGVSDVVLRGGGTGRLVFDGPEVGLMIAQGSTRVAVEGLSLVGHGVSVDVLIRNASFVRVAGCDVSGATRRPKTLSPPYAAGVLIWSSDDVTLEGNELHGNGVGVEDFGGADILTSSAGVHHRRLIIAGNRVRSTATGQNITLFDTSHSRVSGNVVSGASWLNGNHLSGGYGILLYRTPTPGAETGSNVVAENVVSDTVGTGIFLQGQPGSVVANNVVASVATRQLHEALSNGCIAVESDPDGPGIAVSGNHAAGCGLPRQPWPSWEATKDYTRGDIVQSEHRFWHALRGLNAGHRPAHGEGWSEIRAGGIEALGRGHSVVGNTIDGCAGAGIVARTLHESTIASNVVRKAGAQGILCVGAPTCESVVVSGNQISDNARLGDGSAFGISGPFGHSSIEGNVLQRIGGVGITNAGGGEQDLVAHNLVVDAGLKNPSYPAIHLYGGASHLVVSNKVATAGAAVHSKACFVDASQNSALLGNDCGLDGTGPAALGPRSLPGSAPPSSGAWVVGDRILNVQTVKGKPAGWICVGSGTPGQWVPMPKAP